MDFSVLIYAYNYKAFDYYICTAIFLGKDNNCVCVDDVGSLFHMSFVWLEQICIRSKKRYAASRKSNTRQNYL